MTDLNGQSYDVQATKASTVDVRLQQVLSNPRFVAPIQLGSELTNVLFTDLEMTTSTLTGRRVNGQVRQPLDPAKLCLIDSLLQAKCGVGEAEFSGIRSGIRDALAKHCKYLRLKLSPQNSSII